MAAVVDRAKEVEYNRAKKAIEAGRNAMWLAAGLENNGSLFLKDHDGDQVQSPWHQYESTLDMLRCHFGFDLSDDELARKAASDSHFAKQVPNFIRSQLGEAAGGRGGRYGGRACRKHKENADEYVPHPWKEGCSIRVGGTTHAQLTNRGFEWDGKSRSRGIANTVEEDQHRRLGGRGGTSRQKMHIDVPKWKGLKDRPSPPMSATLFAEGYRARGGNGKMWRVSITSRGIHRWVPDR